MIVQRKNGRAQLSSPPRAARRSLAMLCVLLGIAGCILPIIPGLPFFVIAARLLGRRDRQLRRTILLARQTLRRLRGARQPFLRQLGLRLTPYLHTITRLMLGA